MRKKIGEDRTCSSEDMIVDRRTHTHIRVRSKLKIQNSTTFQGLFKDPYCFFQAPKLSTKSHILDADIQNLDCNVTLKCTALYCTHQYRNDKSKISKFARFKFKDFSRIFKHFQGPWSFYSKFKHFHGFLKHAVDPDTQTDTLITILRFPNGGGAMIGGVL